MQLGGFNDLIFLEADIADLQLRDRRGACAAEGEASAIQVKIAGDRAAPTVRLDLQRPRHSGSQVVPVQEQGPLCVEGQVQGRRAARKCHGAAALDRAAARRRPCQAIENQA